MSPWIKLPDAEIGRVLRFDGIEGRLHDPPAPVVVTDVLPKSPHHGWKFIRFGPDGKLYVPVGAPCNVCDPPPPFASILRMNPDAFRWVQLLAHQRHAQLVTSLPDPGDWTAEILTDEMATYWHEHDSIGIDADARAGSSFEVERETGRVMQTLHDPARYHEWIIEAEVDLEKSRALERAVIRPVGIRRL